MTLSDDRVIRQLNQVFVSGWANIKGRKKYAGSSNTHLPEYDAKNVNTCSGHHNIQMFFMTHDGRVLHCLPGYWDPDGFLSQAKFTIELAKLYHAKSLPAVERNDKFLEMHLQRAYGNDYKFSQGSKLQGFDVNHVKKHTDDFVRDKGFVQGVKTADQVVHERMAERPFVPFAEFDTGAFINMGIKRYKYDFGVPGKDSYSKKGSGSEKGTSTKYPRGKTASGKS